MQLDKPLLTINPWEALGISATLMGSISFMIIYFQMVPHIPIMISLVFLLSYAIFKKVKLSDIEESMVAGVRTGIGAIILFFFIGMLISSWMASGTIPTFVFLAAEIVSGHFYFAIVFIVTAIIGISIGSSFTTAATLGVAFVSVSSTLDISPAITAGAVISGAFFGDKMSPLSDTTNLAAMVVGVDLFDHIRNMMWTTVPAFILSLIGFAILSPDNTNADFSKMTLIKDTLLDMNLVQWYSIIPFIVLAFAAVKKVPAVMAISASVVSAIIVSFFIQHGLDAKNTLNMLYSGYRAKSGMEEIDSLLNRGGMESMMFSVSLVILALSMGGMLFTLGILPALLKAVQGLLKGTAALISSAAGTAIGINFLLGEQYLSILLTGNAFKEHFSNEGLEPKNLSRVLEDAGTVINPLVPWGVSGIFLTNVLGVATIDYLPFTFFCLLSPVMTVIFGMTGLTITKTQQKPVSA